MTGIMMATMGTTASEVVVFAEDGLYDQTSINSINVGATVAENHQDAEILGTEPSNGAFGSVYSENTFYLGDTAYMEFEIVDAIDTANFRIGIQRFDFEAPDQLCGTTANSFGLLPNGDLQVNGDTLVVAGGFSYANGDIIGIRATYTGKGLCAFSCFKNDVLQSIDSTLSVMSLFQQSGYYRFAATIGQNTDTGAKISAFFSSIDQTYTKDVPLDDIVRPRNIAWTTALSSWISIDGVPTPGTATATATFVFNTDGTYSFTRTPGVGSTVGTWRADGLTDTTNYQYSIVYTENNNDGTITAQGGAVIDENTFNGFTTLSSDGLGIQLFATVSNGVRNESADVEIQIQEIADPSNRTGIMLTTMSATADST